MATRSNNWLTCSAQIEELRAWYVQYCRAERVFSGSALNVQGVDELKAWLVEKLPEVGRLAGICNVDLCQRMN